MLILKYMLMLYGVGAVSMFAYIATLVVKSCPEGYYVDWLRILRDAAMWPLHLNYFYDD